MGKKKAEEPRAGAPEGGGRKRRPSKAAEIASGLTDREPCDKCGQVHGRCSGHTKHGPNAGKPCGANPRAGARCCPKHGGNHPGQQKAARERLLELVDPALAALHKVLTDPNTDDHNKVRAAQLVLDRTGFKPGVHIEVGMSRFDELLAGAVGLDTTTGEVKLSRDLGPVERGSLSPGSNPLGIEDYEQAIVSAQEDVDRERHNDEGREYEGGRIRPDENTVKGEVIVTDEDGPFPPPAGPGGFDDIGGRRYPRRRDVPSDVARDSPPRYDPEAE